MTLTEAYLANTQAFLLDSFTVRAYRCIENTFAPSAPAATREQIQDIVLQEAMDFYAENVQPMAEIGKDWNWLTETFMANWN